MMMMMTIAVILITVTLMKTMMIIYSNNGGDVSHPADGADGDAVCHVMFISTAFISITEIILPITAILTLMVFLLQKETHVYLIGRPIREVQID